MNLYFSDSSCWGKTTIMPLLGSVQISQEGIVADVGDDVAKQLIDNNTIFDSENRVKNESIEYLEMIGVNPEHSLSLDDYTKDEDVILSIFDTLILEKSLYFLTLDQLGELVDKLELKRPKSESQHVWIKLLVKKIPAEMWKELIDKIFSTFKVEQ